MAYQSQQISVTDFSRGIDQRSAPSAIPEGFSEDLRNVVANSNGFLSKRPGYEGYFGYLPIRVKSITHTGTSITFVLDSSINIGNVVSTPIIVYGKLSAAQSGDFSTTDSGHYYTLFDNEIRSTLSSPSDTETVSHAVGVDEVLLQVNQSTDPASSDNTWIIPDRLDIDAASPHDIDVTGTVPSAVSFFTLVDAPAGLYTHPDHTIQYTSTFVDGDVTTGTDTINDTSHGFVTGDKVRLTTSGTLPAGLALLTDYYIIRSGSNSYKLSSTRAGAIAGTPVVDITAAAGGGTHTATVIEGFISISAATHALSNFNIIPHVYYLDGTEYVRLELPDVTINSSTGTVTVAVTNSVASTLAIRVVLSAADPADVETTTVSATTTGTIVVSTTDPFNFFALYNAVGAVNTLVIPNSIVYSASASTLTISIYNGSGSAESYRFFYRAVEIASSQVTVTDTGAVSTSYTDSAPQLTMWGVSHEDIYTTSEFQEGHANHIDTYRTESQTRVVAGLGGNLFSAQTRAESSSEYKIPTASIDLEGQVSSDIVLAPVFVTTGGAADRTNGNVVADDVSDNKALVTAVTYVSSGVISYTLALTSKVGSLATAINTTSATADYLTVTGMANSINNGTFKITAVDNSVNTITVTNSAITFAGFDETGAQGRAGVFTDRMVLSASSKFQVGDLFSSSVFDDCTPTVLTSSGTTVVLTGMTGRAFITTGSTVYPFRDASVIPLASTMANFVKGDMCTLTGLNRKVRVLSVNNNSDLTISSITGSGTAATVTTSTAHNLQTGDTVVLLRTGNSSYDSEQMLTSVPSSTTFMFTSTATASVATGTVLGKTVYIDEEVTIQDDAVSPYTLAVVGRWLPAEAPTTSDTLPKTTYIKHLAAQDYHKQVPLRSTMVNDTLYMTDYYNEVMKFDGTSIYQAGLPRWQPQLFARVNTTTASIPVSGVTATPTAIAGNKFTVGTGEAAQFSVGNTITHLADNVTYTVQAVDTINHKVYTTVTIATPGTLSTITKVSRYKYSFRLNVIDANNNIIASASTGKDNFIIDLSAAGQLHMRLVGMPVWGNFDYDTIELEVYRTQLGSDGPFYRVAIKDASFSAGAGYIDFNDAIADEFLKDVDPVATATIGSGLGTGWALPLRAKYITSLDNRLILGNVKDYPELDIVMRSTTSIGGVTAANLSTKKFRFKKDSASVATTTDMVNIVNYEFVNSGDAAIASIASTSTTFTVTKVAHGLVAGNWVYLFHSSLTTTDTLNFAGWFQIASIPTADTFTILFSEHGRASGGGTAADVDRYVAAATPANVPVWLGTDYNLGLVGANTINEFTAMLRLAGAINASMRMASTTLAPTFIPWITANAGDNIGIGRLLVRQEKISSTTLSVVLPATITGADVYVKGIKQSASAEVSSTSTAYQSRVLLSYRNNPELFDNPTGDEVSSTAVVDVNSADGQEVTGIIPFFGDSVFGQGTSEGVLVVFKTNSIYLVDVTNRQKSKIQSRGLGCTAPDSIASTKDGIMFANESGIFRLNRNQTITYIGAAVERIFKDEVNPDQLSLLRGHHYGAGGQYKLSVPVGSSSQLRNNQVLVYDHQAEKDGAEGAWTRFTNHPATGWTNLASNAFFGTSTGQVFKIRDAGDSSDYRDDASAVDDMEILLRANALGAPGSRKIIFNVVSHFQLRTTSMEGTELLVSSDLDGAFVSAGTFTLTKGALNKGETVKSSLPSRRVNYIQLKYTNTTKDEDVILSGVEYTAALLNVKGIQERSETT